MICPDKTGTLTQNKMTVTEVVLQDCRVTLAQAVAGQLGLTDTDTCLTGQDLKKMTEEELNLRIPKISVFARVSPSHKMIIIDVPFFNLGFR